MSERKTDLQEGEEVIREGRANLQRGAETVGGRAWLTSQRLIFESHKLNVQTGAEIVPVGDIRGAQPGFTKFLGFLPIVPNAVVLDTAGGELRLTVSGRGGWVDDLRRVASSS